MEHITEAFAKCERQKRAALVAYVTAGYPTIEETVDILLGLENGGAGRPISRSRSCFAAIAYPERLCMG